MDWVTQANHHRRVWTNFGQSIASCDMASPSAAFSTVNTLFAELGLAGGDLRIAEPAGQHIPLSDAAFVGRPEGINAVYELPGGRIVLARYDEPLEVWTAFGALENILEGGTAPVAHLSDGTLVTGGRDGRTRLWSIDGELLTILDAGSMTGEILELSDGRLLSRSEQGLISLWSIGSGAPANFLWPGEGEPPLALADGSRLARIGQTLQVQSSRRGQSRIFSSKNAQQISAIILSDGRLIGRQMTQSPRIWSADGKDLLGKLDGHEGYVVDMIELQDGRILSWGRDGNLRIWSADGQCIAVLEGHCGHDLGACELSDGRILSWCFNCELRLWSSGGELQNIMIGHTSGVVGAMEMPGGQFLSWSLDYTLRLWSKDGTLLRVLEGHEGEVYNVIRLNDGRILSGCAGGIARIWSHDALPRDPEPSYQGRVQDFRCLSDGRFLVWGWNQDLQLLSRDGLQIGRLEGHDYSVSGALELADGRILSWSRDHTLRTWTSEGRALAIFEGHNRGVDCARVLADGRIISWSDTEANVWTDEGQLIRSRERQGGHSDYVTILPDGHIVELGYKADPQIWSADYQEKIGSLDGHEGNAGVIALQDGRVLSWDDTGTIRFWSPVGELLAWADGDGDPVSDVIELRDGCLLGWGHHPRPKLWSADGMPQILEGHDAAIRSVSQLSDGTIMSWDYGGLIKTWSPGGTRIADYRGARAGIEQAIELGSGGIAARLQWESQHSLWVWDKNGTGSVELSGHRAFVNGIVQFDDDQLTSWSDDGTLRRWRVTGEQTDCWICPGGSIQQVRILGDGRMLVLANRGLFVVDSALEARR
jgi:WD40 repeat protein